MRRIAIVLLAMSLAGLVTYPLGVVYGTMWGTALSFLTGGLIGLGVIAANSILEAYFETTAD